MRNTPPHKANIAAVVITFNPSKNILDLVRIVSNQVAEVIIIDNSSNSNVHLASIKPENATIVYNGTNYGIAKGLNQGVFVAKNKGMKWVLMYDQDSMPFKDQVETLVGAYKFLGITSPVAQISSTFIHKNSGYLYNQVQSNLNKDLLINKQSILLDIVPCCTSGTMLSLDAFETIGPFRQDFFIDHVDTEYFLRSYKKGFKSIASLIPSMEHEAGTTTEKYILWRKVYPSNHSPFRWKRIVKNQFKILFEYGLVPIRIHCSMWGHLARHFIKMILFEKEKLAKLKNAYQGLQEAIAERRSNPSSDYCL